MRLVIDASTLIAEALRARGRELLGHSDLDLLIAAEAWGETKHELRKRTDLIARTGRLSDAQSTKLLDDVLAIIAARVNLALPDIYIDRLAKGGRRVLRDARDAPSAALALTLDYGIWTGDQDFFGCGIPVWTTETLRLHLENLQS